MLISMCNFIFMNHRNIYLTSGRNSTSFTILSMSFIKSRLDISPLSATKKKPAPRNSVEGFFFWLLPQTDHLSGESIILPVYLPSRKPRSLIKGLVLGEGNTLFCLQRIGRIHYCSLVCFKTYCQEGN